ncbi:hypothetical protein LX32DRAFT_43590 [Colletotrichum zoysiae]|uniref:Secreted protein n=1 Tax=Colletotrichum zoysiae TaxID=1216348 RepID=A0AAD9M580_9PEZI|nr:hypothetical protein LX32DRAFT_43590 [Colletotrichum zoysiae]
MQRLPVLAVLCLLWPGRADAFWRRRGEEAAERQQAKATEAMAAVVVVVVVAVVPQWLTSGVVRQCKGQANSRPVAHGRMDFSPESAHPLYEYPVASTSIWTVPARGVLDGGRVSSGSGIGQKGRGESRYHEG